VADDTQVPGREQDLEARMQVMAARMDEMAVELDRLRGGRADGHRSPDVGAGRPHAPAPVPSRSGQPAAEEATPSDARISRRGALALAAAAAVGLGAVADSVLAATPAGATTGNLQFGLSNDAGTAATNLTSTATYETLSVTNTANGNGYGIVGSTQGTTSTGTGVFGETYGLGDAMAGYILNSVNASAAVYGSTNGSGPGLGGSSAQGYGVEAQGGLAPLHLVPAGAAGSPTGGTHIVGELFVDSDGVLYSCQAAGTPGTWGPVLVGGVTNTLGAIRTFVTTDIDQVALTVENTSTGAAATALVGSDGGTGTGGGLRGECDNPANTSAAVAGITNGPGAGLAGASLGAGYGAVVSGGLAPILLEPSGTTGPPTTGTHALGELYVDADGVQYRCAAAGTPGTWVPQYSVVPLPAPVRVIATPTATGGISGPLVPGATVHTSTVLTGANGIPTGAVGVVGNLAVSGVGGALLNGYGVMTIFPAGEATPATANINAGAGCFAESNTVTVAFGTGANAGQVSIVWNGGGPVPDAQAYLDVIAYLL